jgi:phospholipid transport system substrate-binding protein
MGRRMRRLSTIRPERRRRRRAAALLVGLMLVLCAPGFARAAATEGASAGNFLTDLTDRAVAQLAEPGLAKMEQEKRFRRLFGEAFDLPAIGRFVLGRYWRRIDATQRSEFLDAFESMMLHRFLPLFSQYAGEKFEMGPIRPYKNNPDFFSVESKLRQVEGEPIKVNWRIRRHAEGYKIVDIVAEGVSIAVTLRSEYVSVLKRNGGDVEALTQVLREKTKGL